ncbi:hypothetical protein HO173_010587 [Letharia columbiana]|uniref:Uncharacterized protein n=1 Tax=Letharia columbiana TaxID=112416 RepID=A0A8H6L0Q7_9LECA|nr:uncharacterized protein HO173_010587 [Letharia columbiana]KAF6231255.1 hypothetical protein HO173_010587 [Letharia columbiana]
MDIADISKFRPHQKLINQAEQVVRQAEQVPATKGQEPTTLTMVDEQDSSFIVAKLDPRLRMAEGFPALTVRERNDIALKCVSYWLDMSNLNAPCKGPEYLRKGSETARDTSCRFSMTMNLDAALIQAFFTIQIVKPVLPPEFAVYTVKQWILIRSWETQTQFNFCLQPDKSIEPVEPRLVVFRHARPDELKSREVSLIENVNGLKVLAETSNHTFEWRNPDLANILLAISNPDSDGPKVYADWPDCVNAALGDDKRALDTSIKLARRKLDGKTLTAKDVPLVRTAAALSEQIEDCHLGPNDIIVEWSFNTNALLDMTNIKCFLKQTGYDSQTLLPSSGHALLRPTMKFLSQAPPENRSLPQDLLQGLEGLLWVDDDCTQSNTLDHYFDLLEREIIVDAPTALGEEQDGMDLDDERSDSEKDDENTSNMELISEDSSDETWDDTDNID